MMQIYVHTYLVMYVCRYTQAPPMYNDVAVVGLDSFLENVLLMYTHNLWLRIIAVENTN